MNDTSTNRSGDLLQLYLAADLEPVSAEQLTRIIEECVDPIIAASIRHKLKVSLGSSDERQENEQARDLASEARTLVIDKLQKLRSGQGNSIEDLDAYVRRVAVNVCNKYLRDKYPNRLRLKNQLRYLFTHDHRFSLWRSDSAEWLCSLRIRAHLQNGNGRTVSIEEITEKLNRLFDRERISRENMRLAEVAGKVLGQAAGPLLFGDVVGCVYTLQRVREPSELTSEAIAYADLHSNDRKLGERMEDAELLRAIWKEIKLLPLKHRSALILSLRTGSGEGLAALLPTARIATLTEIAEVLGIQPIEFRGSGMICHWTINGSVNI